MDAPRTLTPDERRELLAAWDLAVLAHRSRWPLPVYALLVERWIRSASRRIPSWQVLTGPATVGFGGPQ